MVLCMHGKGKKSSQMMNTDLLRVLRQYWSFLSVGQVLI